MFQRSLFLLALTVSITVNPSNAFLRLQVVIPTTIRDQRLDMVGGSGWDNADYLSGLSGDNEKRQKAADDYQEFSDRRRAFLDRQKEIMKSPQGRAFLEKQQQQQQQRDEDMPPGSSMPGDEIINVTPGSGGGSRMAEMMAQAKRMKEMQDQMGMQFFEQKFAVPLDEDEVDDTGDDR